MAIYVVMEPPAPTVAEAIERRRKERALTVIYADHDGILEPYPVDRVVFLEDGRLLARPSHEPPPDRASYLGLPSVSLGGGSVLGGSLE